MTVALITKADPFIDDAERLFRLLEDQERRIQRIFLTAIFEMKNEVDLDDLTDLISQGRAAEAIARLQSIANELAAASNFAFVTAGASAAELLTDAGLGRIAFDQVNLRAVAAMQRNRLDLVREFAGEQRKATHTAIAAGVRDGSNPIAQARNFRDSIGLTQRQWGHVDSYRATLERVGREAGAATDALNRKLRDGRSDRTVMRAARTNTPLTPAQIDRMVGRYAERYVKHRAEVIARTEALRAVHQGNEEAYQQAIDEEVITADSLKRVWRTSVDGRERDTHRALNGQEKAWGEAWTTVNGTLRFPGDPQAPAKETIQCRCAILTRIERK